MQILLIWMLLPVWALAQSDVTTHRQIADTLSEVVIQGMNTSRVFNSAVEAVEDFELLDNDLILLASYRGNNGNKALLRLIDGNGHTHATRNMPVQPVSLFKSCVGKYYYVSNDQFFLLGISPDSIGVSNSGHPIGILPLMEQCQIVHDSVFYNKEFDQNSFAATFSYTAAGSVDKNIFLMIEDSNTAYSNLEEYMQIQQLLAMGNLKLAAHKNHNRVMWNRESIAKISATIFKTDSGLVVFDLYYKLIRFFTFGGIAVKQLPILFSWKRDTQIRIVYDEVWGKFYLHKYHNQSGQSIQAINMNYGDAGEPVFLEKPLATRIKIKNNTLFYIYKNPSVQSLPQLYRQKIN